MIVTISGPDGSGKTVFARRLADELGARATLLHVDDTRRTVEWNQPGRSEADIYYQDYFDLDELGRRVAAASAEIVLVEGVFVRRVPALADAFAVYLDVAPAVAEARIMERDVARGRSPEDVRHRTTARYRPAQARYLAEHDARERADVLVENSQARRPRVVRGEPAAWPAPLAAPLRRMLGTDRTPFSRDILLLPNLISLGRILFICVAAMIFLLGYPFAALAIGVPAGLSDYLDGYLARRRGETTQLGALLDVLADILFTLVCLTIGQRAGVWPAYLLIVWGFRDMSVMVLRASAGQQGFAIRSSYLGKVAANFNSYAFVFMALDIARPLPSFATAIHWLGLFGIHAGIALQWIAGISYLIDYSRKYRG